jgi:hypothetical protein
LQINNLLPVLLELLAQNETSRANANKPGTAQSLTKQHLPRVQPNPSGPAQNSEQSNSAGGAKTVLEQITHSSQGQLTANKETGDPQSELIFLPLPLKSELYPDAKFYRQVNDEEKSGQDGDENQNRLVFGLKTASLGDIYFLVVQRESNLSIQCAASKLQTVDVLRKGFAELEKKLKRLGWQKVHYSCVQTENPGEPPIVMPSGFIDYKI